MNDDARNHEREDVHDNLPCIRRPALFWIIAQPVVAISYRRFGSIIKGQDYFGFLTPEDGTDSFSRNVGKKVPLLAA
jgi:hypothetical protein